MAMKSSVLALVLVALSLVFSPALAQKNCSKGKPCGNTCISMSYTCRVGGGTAGWSSGSPSSDYNSTSGTTSSTNYDDNYSDTSNTSEPSLMSGGALAADPIVSDAPSGDIVELYTGLPTPQAYSRVKNLLEVGTFTEDVNVVYADDLTVQFSENTIGMAVLRMQGNNSALMDEISAVFN